MTPASAPTLRAMSIADMLDGAFQLYRRNFGRFVATTLVVHAITYTLLNSTQFWLMSGASSLGKGGSENLWQMLVAGVFSVLALLLYIAGYQVVSAALAWGTARLYLGENFEVAEAYTAVLGRLGTLVGTWLLVGLSIAGLGIAGCSATILVGFMGNLVGGTALTLLLAVPVGLAALGVFLWATIRLFLATPVAMIENVGPMDALRRSWRLSGGSIEPGLLGSQVLRASILLLVVGAITSALSLLGSGPKLAATAFYVGQEGLRSGLNPAAVPLALLLPLSVLELLVQAVILPFSMMVVVLFYFDARIRREGLDLELLAGRLAGHAS